MIFTVSEFTRQIKKILEEQFPFAWVEGEISNVTLHASGHCFFTLKDEKAQVRAVMFRASVARLSFRPENGVRVVVRGAIGVYEARGEYQIIADFMEPRGIGGLRLAFEQTKEKLRKEGLFDPVRKKPLPALLKTVAVITSPTGAAMRDILRVFDQHGANLDVLIVPAVVQGAEAPPSLVEAFERVNSLCEINAVIVARGGGSMEDLWAFNDEDVARAIARSTIPVISAVGHEIDFTIADFVADVRASTPTAAAKLVVERKENLETALETLNYRLRQVSGRALTGARNALALVERGLVDPQRRIADLHLRSDDLGQRLSGAINRRRQKKGEEWMHANKLVLFCSPADKLKELFREAGGCLNNLETGMRRCLEKRLGALEKVMTQLDAQSPLAILKRGYSITRTWPELKAVRDARVIARQQKINIKLHRGELLCAVEDILEGSSD